MNEEDKRQKASRHAGMTKGEITLLITGAITATAFFFEGDVRSFVFTLGMTGIIGCATNVLAIRMLFDRIYLLPWCKKWPLPYSGVLEAKREDVAIAIGWVVSRNLISPSTIVKAFQTQGFKDMVRAIVKQKLNQVCENPELFETLVLEIDDHLVAFVESPIFEQKLREALYQRFGRVGQIFAHAKRLHSHDKVTPRIQGELKRVLQYICADASFQERLRDFLRNLPERFFVFQPPLKDDIKKYGGDAIKEIVEKIEIEKLVAAEISAFAPGDMRDMILKFTAENLDWLEVWGGFLGSLGGALFWAALKFSS